MPARTWIRSETIQSDWVIFVVCSVVDLRCCDVCL